MSKLIHTKFKEKIKRNSIYNLLYQSNEAIYTRDNHKKWSFCFRAKAPFFRMI